MRRLGPAALATLLALATLVGCSGTDGGEGADGAATGSTAGATGSADEQSASAGASGGGDGDADGARQTTVDGLPVPDGVELTEEGSELGFGDRAQVAYVPRQGEVAALMLRVRKVQVTDWRTSFEGFRPPAEPVTPYFVRVTARNIGETGLARRPVPLYAADADGRLFEASDVEGDFDACSPGRLPKRFGPAAKPADVCLVYLLPEGSELDTVAFRPSQQYDAITWSGDVQDISKDPEELEDEPTEGATTEGGGGDQGDDG